MSLEVPRRSAMVAELARIFPDEDAARRWFEELQWPDGERICPGCGSGNTHECAHESMPYRCRACRRYFSVRTGTMMAGSPLPLLKWAYAIHLDAAYPNGASSMDLHRSLGVTQKSAWHMRRRIRKAFRGAETNAARLRLRPVRSGHRSKAGKGPTERALA